MPQRGFTKGCHDPGSPHEILLKRRMAIKEYGQYAGPLACSAGKKSPVREAVRTGAAPFTARQVTEG